METLELRTPIVHPKTESRIGNWNMRTLYAQGQTAQAAKAMREAAINWTQPQTTTWQWPDLTWTQEGKRKRGRPKTTWRHTEEKERSKAGWQSWREVRTAAQDRNRWRAHVEALCANLVPGDRWRWRCKYYSCQKAFMPKAKNSKVLLKTFLDLKQNPTC